MADEVLLTNIQKFSVNDGPGFRTNVFLKGCNLRCAWCHNPETQASHRELSWKRMKCAQCGRCMDACPQDAINPPIPPEEAREDSSTYYKIILERCDRCMKCVEACQYDALQVIGQEVPMQQILDEVEQDSIFYNNSGGGMTVTGGEPVVHPEFTAKLLEGAKARGMNTCLDTSGSCPWEVLEPLLRYTDIVLYDLKHPDSAEHKRMTGVGNELILENLKRISEKGIPCWIRVPTIPNYNDSLDCHRKIIAILKALPNPPERVDLLPFHNWCEDKYRSLGRKWELEKYQAMEPTLLKPAIELYKEAGLKATLGGSGFE